MAALDKQQPEALQDRERLATSTVLDGSIVKKGSLALDGDVTGTTEPVEEMLADKAVAGHAPMPGLQAQEEHDEAGEMSAGVRGRTDIPD